MARLSTYTKDLNLTGKDMLAGSNYITTVNGVDQFETNNFTLKKITEYINGQIVTDPSIISLKANGGLVYETVNSTNYLAVDLSATNITGQLANSDLANSTITINGTSVALGGSITIGEVTEVIAGTYLNGGGTEGVVTLNHDSTTRTDSTSSASPNYGASFTVIDSIVTNGTGHITDVNTKTVTLPVSDDTNTTYTQEAIDSSNDAILRLTGSDSTNDDIKLVAGANITLNVNEGTDEITIASQAFGNVFTVNSEAAMIAATSTGGDLVVRTDVSKTFIHNGGTAGTVADFTELQFSGINTLNITASDGIDTNTTLLTQTANSLTIENSLATASERGGIRIGYTESGKNYPVELDSEKAYVNVPWTDTTYTAGSGLDLVGTEFSHTDTSSQASVDNSGRTYIQDITLDTYGHVTGLTSATETVVDTNDYVDSIAVTGTGTKTITLGRTGTLSDLTATFTDNDTTYTTATSSVLGLVKIGYTENGKNYPVELDNDQMFVNVPWVNDDTTYTAGTGLSLSGTTFNANVVNNATTQAPQSITTTANRLYQVETDDQNNLVVNVPWVDTDTDTTNWNFKVDSNTAENISAGETLTFASGTNVTLGQSGNTITISSTDTDTNNYVTGASVTGTTTKTLTLTRQGLGDLTAQWTDIDTNTQRTDEEIRDVAAAQWVNGTNTTVVVDDNANTIKINATNTNDVDYINAASFNTSNGVLTLSGVGNAGATVDLDGRYLTSYTETDTLATVTARGASTTTDTTFNSHLTIGSAGHWLYIVPNTANTNPTHVHGMAMGWNYSGGSRESNIIFAAGSDANASQEADAQIRFQYKPVSGSIDTIAKLWSGGNLNIQGYLTVQNGGNTITNTKVGQWDTAYGWGNHATAGYSTFSGSYNDLTNKPTIPTNNNQLTNGAGYITSYDITTQTDPKYLRSNADDTSSGSLTVVSYKFNGNASNPTNTTATIYDQANVGLTASAHNFSIRNYNGSSMVESARFTTSSLTVIGDVVAYGSPSDITLKENIKPIEKALDKVEKLQGVTFDWKESDSILNIKEDIGFIAQDVQKVLPELVRENENGKLSLRHQGIIPVLLEAIKELSDKVKALENGSTK